MPPRTPLGETPVYGESHAPELLCPLPRRDGRERLGIGDPPPFRGEDIWNAWELTWLNRKGKPLAATGVFRIPADSGHLIESKSLKLYLGSLAMTRFDSFEDVASLIARDLSGVAGGDVAVTLTPVDELLPAALFDLPGSSIDGSDIPCDVWEADASLLRIAGDEIVSEALHSHLLRSNCPVTGQPDTGSVLIHGHQTALCAGPIDRLRAL
jgi:7-cyano-7-deazaguanine reductase